MIFALDHAIFSGVMSNAIIGLLLEITAPNAAVPRRAVGVVFWGMNIGLIGLVVLAVRLFGTSSRAAEVPAG